MTFNLFGTPTRTTLSKESVVATTTQVSIAVNHRKDTRINEVDSHVNTAREMQEIRKALLVQQAMEDEEMERHLSQSKTEATSHSILNTSRTMTESSSSPTTPSPQRRHRYDAYNHWDTIEAEKKDDFDVDVGNERQENEKYDSFDVYITMSQSTL